MPPCRGSCEWKIFKLDGINLYWTRRRSLNCNRVRGFVAVRKHLRTDRNHEASVPGSCDRCLPPLMPFSTVLLVNVAVPLYERIDDLRLNTAQEILKFERHRAPPRSRERVRT